MRCVTAPRDRAREIRRDQDSARQSAPSVPGGFEVLLTTDRRIRYQQNLDVRRIALVVLTGSTKWTLVQRHADRIAAAVASATPGSYVEVETPFDAK